MACCRVNKKRCLPYNAERSIADGSVRLNGILGRWWWWRCRTSWMIVGGRSLGRSNRDRGCGTAAQARLTRVATVCGPTAGTTGRSPLHQWHRHAHGHPWVPAGPNYCHQFLPTRKNLLGAPAVFYVFQHHPTCTIFSRKTSFVLSFSPILKNSLEVTLKFILKLLSLPLRIFQFQNSTIDTRQYHCQITNTDTHTHIATRTNSLNPEFSFILWFIEVKKNVFCKKLTATDDTRKKTTIFDSRWPQVATTASEMCPWFIIHPYIRSLCYDCILLD